MAPRDKAHRDLTDAEYTALRKGAEAYLRRMRRKPPAVIVEDLGPRPGKIPEHAILNYIKRGFTNAEILEALRHEHGVLVTRAAISAWRNRRNLNARPKPESRDDLIPWAGILEEHNGDRLIKALRAEARLRDGDRTVNDHDLQIHRSVRRDLTGPSPRVIAYSRSKGFYLVSPRPGIDNDWILDPRR